MGRKTVRWNKLQDPKYGTSSCDKCRNSGMIQEYDYIYGKTYYYFCDCYFGERAKQKERRETR